VHSVNQVFMLIYYSRN